MKDVTKIQINTFMNKLMSYCNGSEIRSKEMIENIAKTFDIDNSSEVSYIDFFNKLQYEYEKLVFLEQFYWKMKEGLEFRGSQNLYELLSMFDTKRDKKFTAAEFQKFFLSKSMAVSDIELSYLFDEYDPKQ